MTLGSIEIVEQALLSHPDVISATVAAEPDTFSGEKMVAYVARRGESISAERLREFVRGRLGGLALADVCFLEEGPWG